MVALLEEYNPSLAKTDPPAKKCSTENFCDSDNRVEKLLSQAQDLRPMKVVLSYETASGHSYGPFGELVSEIGTYAGDNTYKFSTKPQDTETGYYYYGHRYLDNVLGKWLNRDPVEENGGTNLYAFVTNNSIIYIDPLGLTKDTAGSFSLYVGLGGGGSADLQTNTSECCKDGTTYPEGMKEVVITGSVEVGVGLGGDLSIAGWHKALQIKGPQITGKIVEITLSNSDCNDFSDMSGEVCSSLGINWGLSGSVGLGPFAASIGGQVSGEIKGCVSASSSSYTYSIKGCWDNGGFATASLAYRTWTFHAKRDSDCTTLLSTSGSF